MDRRKVFHGVLLALALRRLRESLSGLGQGRTRLTAARRGSRTPDLGCSTRRLAQRGDRFFDNPALRGKSFQLATENFFDFLPRAQLRRNGICSSRRKTIWHGSPGVGPHARRELAGGDRRIRLLLRRTERRCRSAARMVPFEALQDEDHRGLKRRRRRRTLRRLSDLSRESARRPRAPFAAIYSPLGA